jgi:hypothetical protein
VSTVWRVVTGSLDSQDPHGEWAWTWSDDDFETFNEARRVLYDILGEFVNDNRGQCDDCVSQGEEAQNDLVSLPPDEEYHAEVDGHDYCLLKR